MRDRDIVSALKRLKVETGSIVCLGCGYEHNCSTKGCRILREAADTIEELSRENESLADTVNKADEIIRSHGGKWISVEERLPGTGEIVLVYGKRGGIYTAEHNRNARWPGSFWKLNSKSHHCEPTHWMPLPEPPSGES